MWPEQAKEELEFNQKSVLHPWPDEEYSRKECSESSNAGSSCSDTDGHISVETLSLCSLWASKGPERWTGTTPMRKPHPKVVPFWNGLSHFGTGPAAALGCQPDVPVWTSSTQVTWCCFGVSPKNLSGEAQWYPNEKY